jgi:hypothetical protein
MLTQLSTVKARLAIDPFDLQYDAILTNAINAISFRFDKETNRTLARTVNTTQEFDATDTEICLACYPFESLTRFELKTTEAEGWIEQTGMDFLIRRACILSLTSPLATCHSSLVTQVARVTYTGGALCCREPQWVQVNIRCRATWNRPPSNKSPSGFKAATNSA